MIDHESGGTIHTAPLWPYGSKMIDGSYQNSVAFTIRSIKSGERCGLILAMPDRGKFGVSIVHDLKEQDFRHRGFFDRWLESREVPESQDLTRDFISYKLRDGTYLFLGCDDEEIEFECRSSEFPGLLRLLGKAQLRVQLRVGIVK